MKKILLLLSLFPISLIAQVGIGTTLPEAALDIVSSNSGILIPRVALTSTTDTTTVINPQTGALAESTLVYNTAVTADVVKGFYFWNGTVWVPIAGTAAADNDWTMHTNGADMYNANTGNVGIGTNSPSAPLHLVSGGSAGAFIVNQDFSSGLGSFTDTGSATSTWSVSGGIATSGVVSGTNKNSILRRNVTIPPAGAILTFDYNFNFTDGSPNFVIKESGASGVVFNTISAPTGGFTSMSIALPAGTYNLDFRARSGGGSTTTVLQLDNIVIQENSTGTTALRIVDGTEGADKILTSDANGNASWKSLAASDIPNIVDFQSMVIPVCGSTAVGSTGSFVIPVRGVSTTVSWKIMDRVTSSPGPMVGPFKPERLQVRYDFNPVLPITPNGMILTANNPTSFPDTFSLNYASKSASSILINITRTDLLGDGSNPCWGGQFYFDVFMTE